MENIIFKEMPLNSTMIDLHLRNHSFLIFFADLIVKVSQKLHLKVVANAVHMYCTLRLQIYLGYFYRL